MLVYFDYEFKFENKKEIKDLFINISKYAHFFYGNKRERDLEIDNDYHSDKSKEIYLINCLENREKCPDTKSHIERIVNGEIDDLKQSILDYSIPDLFLVKDIKQKEFIINTYKVKCFTEDEIGLLLNDFDKEIEINVISKNKSIFLEDTLKNNNNEGFVIIEDPYFLKFINDKEKNHTIFFYNFSFLKKIINCYKNQISILFLSSQIQAIKKDFQSRINHENNSELGKELNDFRDEYNSLSIDDIKVILENELNKSLNRNNINIKIIPLRVLHDRNIYTSNYWISSGLGFSSNYHKPTVVTKIKTYQRYSEQAFQKISVILSEYLNLSINKKDNGRDTYSRVYREIHDKVFIR